VSTPETPSPDQDLSPIDHADQALHDGLIGRGRHRGLIPFFEDLVHYVVALVLLGTAAFVIFKTVHDLIVTHRGYAQAATTAVNGVLIAIILLEVMRTVMAHFDRAGLQPEPFLIIGIISGVRGILFVGARLSLGTTQGPPVNVHDAVLELGVNGAVVVGLSISLVLLRRRARTPQTAAEAAATR
jgi:uncharacterized membrane protein (DUF373 family)